MKVDTFVKIEIFMEKCTFMKKERGYYAIDHFTTKFV